MEADEGRLDKMPAHERKRMKGFLTGTDRYSMEGRTVHIQRRSIDNSLLVLIKGASTTGNLSDKIQVSLLWWYI